MELPGAVPIPEDVARRYAAQGLWDGAALREGVPAWARRTPHRVAVVDSSGGVTYSRLERLIAGATGLLRGRGIGPGDAVLVVASLTAPSLVAYSAVLRAGAVAVMLDRRGGPADAAHAAALPGVRLVVAPEPLAHSLGLAATGIPVLPDAQLMAGGAPDRDWVEPDPRAAAAVVFTSGTTSRPKGVAHSLNTLRAGARAMAEAFALTAADVAFLSSPLASITGLVQVHLMLERGGGLVLEDRFEPRASLERLRRHGATVLGGAPVIMEQVLAQAAADGVGELPLRAMALGGTMIPRPVLELAVETYGIVPVRMYGASEIPCATGTLPGDRGEARLADDGAAAAGTELRLAEADEPGETGEAGDAPGGDVAGELLVRGPMRCLGYLDAADNDAAFVPGGWFRTGDLGRIEGGRLTVTGRLKEVAARKGLKVSLAEVDEAARSLPGAREVAAYAVPDPETGERVALAVHAADPTAIDFDRVVGHLLGAGLAKWKLPEQVVLWDGPLPRTESGKVQRHLVAAGEQRRRTTYAPRLRG